ncbi:MAG: YdcH family protein [Sphingosinicella sp.]
MERTDSAGLDSPARLAALRTEHRDLDVAIDALRSMAAPDQLQLARLKKRKLRLKDEIKMLEDIAVPDIIA